MSATIPYRALQQMFDPFFRKGEHLHYWKAIYLDRFTDDVIERVRNETLPKVNDCDLGPRWGHGSRRQDETSIGPGLAPFLLEAIGSWTEPAHTEQNVVWGA